MEKEEKFYRKLPEIVKSVLITSEGWVVGKAIKNLINHQEVVDFDIIVPNRELFQIVVKQISSQKLEDFYVNSYGGLKFKVDSITIDIWCEELGHFLQTANEVSYVYNHKKQILIQKS